MIGYINYKIKDFNIQKLRDMAKPVWEIYNSPKEFHVTMDFKCDLKPFKGLPKRVMIVPLEAPIHNNKAKAIRVCIISPQGIIFKQLNQEKQLHITLCFVNRAVDSNTIWENKKEYNLFNSFFTILKNIFFHNYFIAEKNYVSFN